MERPAPDQVAAVQSSFVSAFGAERVITDPDMLASYSCDETSDLSSSPDIVFRAENADEVSAALRICSEFSFPVVPRGAGSGVTGGSVAMSGGLVLSMEKMNRIIEIDTVNMIAVVEPGVITGDLKKAAKDEGLMYPPDPASLDKCSIGGNIAENSGGPMAVKYGITRDYVIGLQFVLPDGRIINSGGKTVKNVMGYNLTGIILASEGTLAVVTKIILRLVPAPPVSIDMLLPFPGLDEAIDGVYKILSARVIPAALEFMEADAIRIVSEYLGGEMPFPEAGAHLLIQLDGAEDEELHRDMMRIAEVAGVPEDMILAAESDSQRERLWKARRSIRDAIQSVSPVFIAEDCSVPRSRIPDFLKSLKSYCESEGLRSVMFGHAGDGNVHIDILKGDMDHEKWQEMLPSLKSEIYRRAIDQGGAITGEHGIGWLKRDYLPIGLSEDEIYLHHRIKDAFDPKGILNPHKVMPELKH